MVVRLGSTWFILAFAVRTLTSEEIALWLLFSTVTGLQILFDFGFSTTFSRSIAYARLGRSIEDVGALDDRESISPGGADRELDRLWASMRSAYTRMAVISLLGGSLVGPTLLAPAIRATELGQMGWVLFGLVVATGAAGIWGARYNAVLVGFNEIALVRRWDTVIGAASAVTSAVVLYAGGGLAGLVIVGLMGQLAVIARNVVLARRFYRPSGSRARDRQLQRAVWAAAWRSGLGVMFGYATFQLGGLAAPRMLDPADVASYLLALRLFQLAAQLANVPFYTHLPSLAEMFATGDREQMVDRARRRAGMVLVVMTMLAVGIVALGPVMLDQMDAAVSLPSVVVLAVLAGGYLAERIGAMGLQLQSAANRIEWHWVNGSTFTVVAGLSIVMGPMHGSLGLAISYAAPVAFLMVPVVAVLTIATLPEVRSASSSRKPHGLR